MQETDFIHPPDGQTHRIFASIPSQVIESQGQDSESCRPIPKLFWPQKKRKKS
jgi:hypothetical protein